MDRRGRLRALIRERGGPKALAKELGYANPSFLVQMAGPNPSREVTERTARVIEVKAGLPEGWLDPDYTEGRSKDMEVLRQVGRALERLKVSLPMSMLADVVQFVLAHSTAARRDEFIGALVPLLGRSR